MVNQNEVAKGVRVKLNDSFRINSLSDQYLACESVLFISDRHIYNDDKGAYVYISGGSRTNSGTAYLSQ
jgi:hypothetical protein